MKEKILMKVICDDREPKNLDAIAKSIGIELIRERLLTGDYVRNDVCIERKTIDDFCASIIDGRLDSQMERMNKAYNHIYVLVSGSISSRQSTIHENSVLGKMASILVKHGVSTIVVDNDTQLLYLMKRIFERHNELKELEVKDG